MEAAADAMEVIEYETGGRQSSNGKSVHNSDQHSRVRS